MEEKVEHWKLNNGDKTDSHEEEAVEEGQRRLRIS